MVVLDQSHLLQCPECWGPILQLTKSNMCELDMTFVGAQLRSVPCPLPAPVSSTGPPLVTMVCVELARAGATCVCYCVFSHGGVIVCASAVPPL